MTFQWKTFIFKFIHSFWPLKKILDLKKMRFCSLKRCHQFWITNVEWIWKCHLNFLKIDLFEVDGLLNENAWRFINQSMIISTNKHPLKPNCLIEPQNSKVCQSKHNSVHIKLQCQNFNMPKAKHCLYPLNIRFQYPKSSTI